MATAPVEGDSGPRGYSRWLLLNVFLAALAAGLTVLPHGLVFAGAWWLWLRWALSRYSRQLDRPQSRSGAFVASLRVATWASRVVLAGLVLRGLVLWAPIEQWLDAWVFAVTPFVMAWLGLAWAHARSKHPTVTGAWPRSEARRVEWGLAALIAIPLLVTGVLQGGALLLANRQVIDATGATYSAVMVVAQALQSLLGVIGAGLLLYRPTVAVNIRVALGVAGMLFSAPVVLVLLVRTLSLGGGVDGLLLLWPLAVLVGFATPLGGVVTAWVAAHASGRLSALQPVPEAEPQR